MTEKTYHFLSGLPRSGSTVLASILNQNPEVYVTPTSPMLNVAVKMQEAWRDDPTVKANYFEEQINDLTKAILPAFWKHRPEPIIIDKGRGFTRPEWNVTIAEHGKSQFGDAYNNRISLKLLSPWYFVCNEPIKFVFTESHYSTSFFRDHNVLIPPGIIDYKYQHSTNVHLSFPIQEEPYVVRLRHGTPLVSMFPITERKINFTTKQVTVQEFNNINMHMPNMFIGKYFKQPGVK